MPNARHRLAHHLVPVGIVLAAGVASLGFTGCSSDDDTIGTCVSTEQYFAEKVWAGPLSQKCIGCHNPTGQAKDSKFILRGAAEAGFLEKNLKVVQDIAKLEYEGQSLLLLKPTNAMPQSPHGGGVQIQKGSEDYAALKGLLARFDHPVECETDVNSFFTGVEVLNWERTLRKAAISLGGRLPTKEERALVVEGGEAALDAVLDKLMTEEVFLERLKQIYNDQFLTDRYFLEGGALDFLADDDGGGASYYNPFWYMTPGSADPTLASKYGMPPNADYAEWLERETNKAVAREPLELIAYIVKNDKPFTEVVTANYMVVNPFSAKAYNIADAKFTKEGDLSEFVPGYINTGAEYGFPHAGVLSSAMWLIRHPTTPTNRNRHRARMVYQYFLGTDILKTAEQPLDASKIKDLNPTMNNPSCTVCHAQIDPIAGTFMKFDDLGRFLPDANYSPDDEATLPWYDSMRLPGFGSEQLPDTQYESAIQWLGSRVAADPRFALAAVQIVYEGLTGQKPLAAMTDAKSADFKLNFKGYLAQYHFFNQVAKQFIDSKYNLKVVVKEIVKSPFFRAVNAHGLTAERKKELFDVGNGQWVIPEQMHRKIIAVLGIPWGNELLDRFDGFHILYGGIDSNDVTNRVRDANGVMANIADRMSNEMACYATPYDFTLPPEERKLFPHVELTFEPKDVNGFEIVETTEAIKKNIVHLHDHVLGEQLTIDHPEVQRTYDLFVAIWEDGRAGMKATENPYSSDLPNDCQVYFGDGDEKNITSDQNYTVRAWMGVMSYLLSDYSFLYE